MSFRNPVTTLPATAITGSLPADQVGTGNFTGTYNIVGAFQTSGGNPRVLINPTGIYAYNGSGAQTVKISATDGSIAITGTFSIATAASGTRVVIDNTGINGYNGSVNTFNLNASTGTFSIATAASGTRVVIDNTGINGYNGSVNTFNLNASTGAVSIIGTLSTGSSGYRVVVDGTGGTFNNALTFYTGNGSELQPGTLQVAPSNGYMQLTAPNFSGDDLPPNFSLSRGVGINNSAGIGANVVKLGCSYQILLSVGATTNFQATTTSTYINTASGAIVLDSVNNVGGITVGGAGPTAYAANVILNGGDAGVGGGGGIYYYKNGTPTFTIYTLGSGDQHLYFRDIINAQMMFSISQWVPTTGPIATVPGVLVIGTGAVAQAGDIGAGRSGGTTGVIYFGSSGVRYLFYNGTSYIFNGASIVVNGTTYTSDRDTKTDIIPLSSVMDKVRLLRPSSYKHLDENGVPGTSTTFGVMAQDLADVYPELVHPHDVGALDANHDPDNPKLHPRFTVDYMALIAVLIKGMQETDSRLAQLEKV
jgi:hypothetical protein